MASPPPSSTSLTPDHPTLAAITAIHSSPRRAVLYTTGGGAPALAWLLGVPGASGTVLEARVPYGGPRAMAAALGGASPTTPLPTSAASKEAAAALAVAAYRHAAQLADFGVPILGLGGAGALATGRERRGRDRFWVATHDGVGTALAGIEFPPGGDGGGGAAAAAASRRAHQDALASRLVIDALARACGVGGCWREEDEGGGGAPPVARAATSLLAPGEDPLSALLSGRASTLELGLTPAGEVLAVVDAPRAGRAYLPGSFNPWHAGHGGALAAGAAAAVAAGVAGCGGGGPGAPSLPLAYELSVVNANKGVLAEGVVRARVAQFLAGGPVAAAAAAAGGAPAPPPLLLTREPLFAGKARLLSSSGASPASKTVWVVGWDTAVRLVDPRYYGGTVAGVAAALADLAARGCVVAVAGRVGPGGGAFRAWDPAADLPPTLAAVLPPGLFVGVPEGAFRADVSSTELRKAHGGVV